MDATVATAVVVEGVGLHTGAPVRVTLVPEDKPGIVFRRADLPGTPPIAALPPFISPATRHTVIRNDAASVATVEHLLAACWGLDITALDVAVEGPELPVGDGSALIWVEALQKGGRATFSRPQTPLVPRPVRLEEGGSSIALAPAAAWEVHFAGVFPDGRRYEVTWTPETDFVAELAKARTFCRLSEVAGLRRMNLARGGNPGNSLVWIDAPVTEEMRREMNSWWPGVSLACDGAGLLESQRLRWPDECARHKLLDLLGDLALLRPVVPCRVAAIQSGHALAHRLVRQCALGQHARETMADLEGSYG